MWLCLVSHREPIERGDQFSVIQIWWPVRYWVFILFQEDLFFPFRIFCQSFLILRAWLADLSRAQTTLRDKWWVNLMWHLVTLGIIWSSLTDGINPPIICILPLNRITSGVPSWPQSAVPCSPRAPGPGGLAEGCLRDPRPDQPGHLLAAAVWLLAVQDPGQASRHYTLHSLPMTEQEDIWWHNQWLWSNLWTFYGK